MVTKSKLFPGWNRVVPPHQNADTPATYYEKIGWEVYSVYGCWKIRRSDRLIYAKSYISLKDAIAFAEARMNERG